LATLATLFGLSPPSPEHCRVLELGCGDGGNLIPMAYGLPNSRFVGLDAAATPLESGRRMIQALALPNITLEHGDLMDVGPSLGEFDYIIAHGLYSWVPPAVQDKILDICHTNLAPDGVAYVSYNTYPGCHLRRVVRDMALFQTRAITEPSLKVSQARAFLDFIAKAQPRVDEYQAFMSAELQQALEHSDGALYHDDLADINEPVYFHQFVEHAVRHRLQFLAEANFFEMQDHIYPPEVVETLRSISNGNPILREQYLDFLKFRRFRQTLLCHQGLHTERPPRPDTIRTFYLSSSARPVSTNPDIASALTVEQFRGSRGAAMATDLPLAKAAILCLGEVWPRALPFDQLLQAARTRTRVDPGHDIAEKDRDAATLAEIILGTHAAGLIDLHICPPPLPAEPSAYPVASPLARLQLQHDRVVTTLRHSSLAVEDELARQLLLRLDGTRDRRVLLAELSALMASGAITPPDTAGKMPPTAKLTGDGLERELTEAARLALLIA
jgi:SAM-dependent methyltransferase